ncbi:hypothetical protein FACS189487_01710 [Campylobacterota bacterium]|nr:hypothetical protein FACS189487_01710 [Campylobacterota bacterium]
MKKSVFGAIVIATVLLFAGCGGGDLAGTDANNNGVRDDVEDYIIKTYTEEKQRKAAMQSARATQAVMLLDLSDKTTAKNKALKVGDMETKAIHCLSLVFDPSYSEIVKGAETLTQVSKKIDAITLNTKARQKAYFEYNHLLDGTTVSLPRKDTCEK